MGTIAHSFHQCSWSSEERAPSQVLGDMVSSAGPQGPGLTCAEQSGAPGVGRGTACGGGGDTGRQGVAHLGGSYSRWPFHPAIQDRDPVGCKCL